MFQEKQRQQLQNLRTSMYALKCIIDRGTSIIEGEHEGEQLDALAENAQHATVMNKIALDQGEKLSEYLSQ